MEIKSGTLGRFGMRLVLENSRDGLSVDAPKRTRAPRGTKQSTGEVSTKVLKDWAASTDWKYNDESPSKYSKRLPVDMEKALRDAYNEAHPLLT
jgi:hypothetical protein